jgi:voltage-gated potassium channel
MSGPPLERSSSDIHARLSRILDWFILLLTLGFGVLFVLYEVLVPESAPELMDRLDFGFTLAFLGSFGLQFTLARDRVAWLQQNWVDVAIVLVVSFPLLRLLRFQRFLPVLRSVRLVRIAAILGAGLRAHIRTYGRGNVNGILVAGVVVILLGAVLVRSVEEGAAEANIRSVGDALWWAVSTVTTVGYGDKYPTTGPGRLLAAGLMLLGIGLFGILTASLSSFFVAESRESDVSRVEAELALLRTEMAGLTRRLDGWMASRSQP